MTSAFYDPKPTSRLADRARGCILAGPIGDAMGGPFEGQPGPLSIPSSGNRNGGGEVIHVPPGSELAFIKYVCNEQRKLKEIRFVAKDGTSYPRTVSCMTMRVAKKKRAFTFPMGH